MINYLDRPWLDKYMVGVPANIDPDSYEQLIDMFDDTFTKYADHPAFTCMGKTLNFKQIDIYSKNFGAYLNSRGLNKGDRIALMMPNMLQYPIALFGALRAGLIVVNTNPLYTPREMLHQFSDSGVKAIVIAENFAANLEGILKETQIDVVITTSIGELLGGMKGWAVNFVVKYIKRMVPKYNIANTVSFSKALKGGKGFTIKPFKGTKEDVILLQYTGGTTGVSKGAMLTNRNLVSNMQQIRAIMSPMLIPSKEIALSPLPMYHIFAFTVNCLALMGIGSHTILVTNARDIPSVIKEMKKHQITILTGVNTLFNALLHNDAFGKLDFKSLKITVGGGMAVQKAVAEKWRQLTGCPLVEGFGMTETSPVASVNPIDGSGVLGTIGLPVPSTYMRVVNENYEPIPVGEVGEIQVMGPQVMKGYYNRPEETNIAVKDGWMCTGDIGLMLPNGYFQIVDRKKDMILVSGFNVYPNEIEDVLAMHPKVLESAAIGVADEKSGEVVKVFVVKKDKSLSESEIKEHCKIYLTNYKVPKFIEFRDELPKTNVGKILRRALRDAK
ncbi:MAG: AMP-binding protein [Saprospiraceae bacterium]|nr:AMP-binding protein [Saprospiraceae bacterium]